MTHRHAYRAYAPDDHSGRKRGFSDIRSTEGSAYELVNVSSDSSTALQHNTGTACQGPASASDPILDDSFLERVAEWQNRYNSAKGPNDRVGVFFEGLSLVQAGLEHQHRLDILEKHRQKSSILSLIDTALSSLDGILSVASRGTRSYDRFLGYKAQLQNYKRTLSRELCLSKDLSLSITELCKEITDLSENLKPISHASEEEAGSHLTSLCKDYKHYLKRKKQGSNRERWAEFIKARKDGATEAVSTTPGSVPASYAAEGAKQ